MTPPNDAQDDARRAALRHGAPVRVPHQLLGAHALPDPNMPGAAEPISI